VSIPQRNGLLLLNNTVLQRQMGIRGITAHQLAEAGGLTLSTMGRFSRGYTRVRAATILKITKGLAAYPVLEGAEALLTGPDGNGHEDKMVSIDPTPDERSPVRRVIRPRRPLWPDEGTPPASVGGLRVIEEKA